MSPYSNYLSPSKYEWFHAAIAGNVIWIAM